MKETQDLGLKATRQLKLKNERRKLRGLQKLCAWFQYISVCDGQVKPRGFEAGGGLEFL